MPVIAGSILGLTAHTHVVMRERGMWEKERGRLGAPAHGLDSLVSMKHSDCAGDFINSLLLVKAVAFTKGTFAKPWSVSACMTIVGSSYDYRASHYTDPIGTVHLNRPTRNAITMLAFQTI